MANHVTAKIGVTFGKKKTTTGGSAIPFMGSARIELIYKQKLKEDNQAIGVRTEAKLVKNKISPPFKSATLDIYFNKGVDRYSGLKDVLASLGILKKDGKKWVYGKDKYYSTEMEKLVADHPEVISAF